MRAKNNQENDKNYTYVSYGHPHIQRAREILIKHPEVRKLFGSYSQSALWILAIVLGQLLLASLTQNMPWWGLALLAFFVGAFANHALYVQIHECCHNLVWKGSTANKLMGIVCDFVLGFPSAMGFRNYHLLHHQYLGEYDYDADLVSHQEAQWVGNKTWRKILWISFFFISQGILRPKRLRQVEFWNRWILLNLVSQIIVNFLIYKYLGGQALIYLFISTFFALGLHPLGGRWIQEHYVTQPGQETYSYYGPLNRLTFNMGYHNEHHDLMMVPWSRLPQLKKLAPEYYDPLYSYQSWTKVLLNFLFSPKMSPYSRIVHTSKNSRSKKILMTKDQKVHGEGVLRNVFLEEP